MIVRGRVNIPPPMRLPNSAKRRRRKRTKVRPELRAKAPRKRSWRKRGERGALVASSPLRHVAMLGAGLLGMLGILFLIGQTSHIWVSTALCVLAVVSLALFDVFLMRGERVWRSARRSWRPRSLLRLLRRGAVETCSYCRDRMDPSETVTCEGCGTAYHVDCQEELLGGCGTIGCAGRVERRAAPSKKAA